MTGTEQLPPKSLMPLWLNSFSRERRCLIKGVRRRLSLATFNGFCLGDFSPPTESLASADDLSWTTLEVFRWETLIPSARGSARLLVGGSSWNLMLQMERWQCDGCSISLSTRLVRVCTRSGF